MTEINEIQTLATPKGVYNSFPDKTAREQLAGKLNAPGGVKAGDYLRVQSVGAGGNVVLEGADPPGEDSGQNVAQIEPAYGDIPVWFFSTPFQQTKTELVCEFWYYSKSLHVHGWAVIKAQGNSTMMWPKKNQSVKLFSDAACTKKLKIDFNGWGEQNKYVFKAYWRDLTHTRDIGSVRLEADLAETRSDYEEMPELLRTSPNMGAVDGFPVVVYTNGIYQGRYMFNIPKDKWAYNMDDDLDEHCMLCSENYVSGCFRAPATIDGSDWTDEIHDTVPASILARWNEVIDFVRNSTDEEFAANLGSYINVNSLIDRHIMGLYSCDIDGYGKNQGYVTYDGKLWYAVPYDKDCTWGNDWEAASMLPSDFARTAYEDFVNTEGGNLLFDRLIKCFVPSIKARWNEVKHTVLSVPNTIHRLRELADIAPPHLIAEDYAPTTAGGAFVDIPNKDICTIQQIQRFAAERWQWTDEYINALVPSIQIPCTGISLDHAELAFDGIGAQQLTATVTPINTTDTVAWTSDNSMVAAVDATGMVTAVGNGSATITATCGSYSASCTITVSGIEVDGPAYRTESPTTFDGTSASIVDTGVMLFDTAKSWTILMEADLTQCLTGNDTVFNCRQTQSPEFGVSFQRRGTVADGTSGNYALLGTGSSPDYYGMVPASANRIAFRCVAGVLDKIAYYNGTEVKPVNLTAHTYAAYGGNLVLGGRRYPSGNYEQFWEGTISQFEVHLGALSDDEINMFLTA